MSQPTPFDRLYSFTDFQTVNPTKPLPASELDAELNAVERTVDDLRTNIGLIQRDDGKLRNQVVEPESLSAATLAVISQGEYNPRGAWATGTSYAVSDLVTYNDATYLAIVGHTSTAAFATDNGAGNWLLIANGALQGGGQAVDLFEGNGTGTAFTLSYTYNGNTAATVFVNGVAQIPTQDFSISGTTITFVVAPPAPAVSGRKNVMVRGTGIEAQLAADAANTASANSSGFADASSASATAAAGSATSAAASATTATSQAAIATAQAATATSEATDSAVSAGNAATSAAAAAASETAAASSASTASTQATTATTQAGVATTKAGEAATSAAAALSSQNTSASNATTSTTKAGEAATSATAAAGSATSAASSASSATTSASTATTGANTATTKASEASASAAAALASKDAAATSETNAAASETAAAASEATASTAATTATTKASEASTSAANAASSATSASNSASSAATSAASAAAALDNFDDRYLGSKASDPTLDNDGNALVIGALYYNSTDGVMKVYTSGGWLAASAASQAILTVYKYTATAGQTTFSGSDDNSVTLAYQPGSALVTLNGVMLEVGTDVTASNGTSVVLASGAVAGDELNVYAFSTFDIANVYTQAQADAKYVVGASAITVDASAPDDSLIIDSSGNLDVDGIVNGRVLQVSGTAAGAFSANAWFMQYEGSSIFRSYQCGPDASTKPKWEHYAASSTGSPIPAFTVSNIGDFAIGAGSSANARLYAKGIDSSATYLALRLQNSAAADLFFVRNDGYTVTGLSTNSPYNATIGLAANLHVYSDGGLYRATSSIQYKRDVVPYTRGLDAVAALRPVFYKGINPVEGDSLYAGLIAEEVHAAGLTEFVQYNQEQQPEGLSYGNMVALAFKAIQEQQAIIEDLKARVSALEQA
jgi:hypothetical protein